MSAVGNYEVVSTSGTPSLPGSIELDAPEGKVLLGFGVQFAADVDQQYAAWSVAPSSDGTSATFRFTLGSDVGHGLTGAVIVYATCAELGTC